MKISIVFICCFAALFSEKEELFVRLKTEGNLIGVNLEVTKGDFSFGNEAAPLADVLRYDLSHNGMTTVLQKGEGQFKVELVLRGSSAYVLLSTPSGQKKSEEIALSGNLSQDRRKIHRLADRVYQTLFGAHGIATSKILFTVRTKNGQGEAWASNVFEADYDGANARQLTRRSGYCVTPAFVPSKEGGVSSSFVYVGYKSGQPKIFLGTVDGREAERVISLGGNQLMPSISRGRDMIAFISDVTQNPDLFIQPFDPERGAVGLPRKIFSASLAVQGTPTFSPDGRRIAFVSNKDGAPRVWVMNVPGEGVMLKDMRPEVLSKVHRECTAPNWSPDGSKIAYCAKSEGVRQIWVYDLKTGVEKQVTRGGLNKENPTFSPNSLCVMYNTTDPGKADLWSAALKGGEAEVLKVALSGEKHYPHWGAFAP